jgi:hypothetical protein
MHSTGTAMTAREWTWLLGFVFFLASLGGAILVRRTTTDYQVAWRRYRRWRAAAVVLMLGGLPAVLYVSDLSREKSVSFSFFVAIGLVWLVAFSVTFMAWTTFPCPYCRRSITGVPTNGLTDKCMHCGLRIGDG